MLPLWLQEDVKLIQVRRISNKTCKWVPGNDTKIFTFYLLYLNPLWSQSKLCVCVHSDDVLTSVKLNFIHSWMTLTVNDTHCVSLFLRLKMLICWFKLSLLWDGDTEMSPNQQRRIMHVPALLRGLFPGRNAWSSSPAGHPGGHLVRCLLFLQIMEEKLNKHITSDPQASTMTHIIFSCVKLSRYCMTMISTFRPNYN